MFKKALQQTRCLLPATGYFEWTQDKQKVCFEAEDRSVLYLAGLYRASFETGQPAAFVILTQDAARVRPDVAQIHDRMPVLLSPTNRQAWLEAPEAAALLLQSPQQVPIRYDLI